MSRTIKGLYKSTLDHFRRGRAKRMLRQWPVVRRTCMKFLRHSDPNLYPRKSLTMKTSYPPQLHRTNAVEFYAKESNCVVEIQYKTTFDSRVDILFLQVKKVQGVWSTVDNSGECVSPPLAVVFPPKPHLFSPRDECLVSYAWEADADIKLGYWEKYNLRCLALKALWEFHNTAETLHVKQRNARTEEFRSDLENDYHGLI